MDIKEFIREIKRKVNDYDKGAKNPFLQYNYSNNPFRSAVSSTKIWVEPLDDKKES